MMNNQLKNAIDDQINAEVYSSYLYYAMAAYFDSLSLDGCSKWMRIQAMEELTHAQRFISFLSDRGHSVTLKAIAAPPEKWTSPLDAFEATLAHEQEVTRRINALMDLAHTHKDHASISFLNWFVDEQVEEESTADDIVNKLKLVDKTEGGIFLLNQELGNRQFVQPPELAGVL